MYNVNGPPRGSNVTSDQSSYDLIYRDIIVDSSCGTFFNNSYIFNLQTDNVNKLYKAELTAATIVFNSSIPTNIKNKTLLLSIDQLNGNTVKVAGNTLNGNTSQGSNRTSGNVFCQVPDNNTPLLIGANASNNTITLLIGPHMYESICYYNPPINNLNRLNIQWSDTQGNNVTSSISTFYFSLRLHYFQKRNNTTAFSVPIFNYAASGTLDTNFAPQ